MKRGGKEVLATVGLNVFVLETKMLFYNAILLSGVVIICTKCGIILPSSVNEVYPYVSL